MGAELKNEFSWSKSRDEAFRECLRKYYFQYYGFWNGWYENAKPRVRQIYMLKQLQTRQMWAGDHVHKRIKDLLSRVRRGHALPPVEKEVETMLEGMRADFKESREHKYRQSPKHACGLFEHEYAVHLPPEAWKEIADHAARCVATFYESDTFKQIREVPVADWLELEERASFLLSGLKVYVQLDFAMKKDADIFIYDWKTGRSEPGRNDVQLACYVLYAVDKWKVAPEHVTAIEFNLAANQETRHPLDVQQLEEIKQHVLDSADEMQFPLTDPEKNIAEEDNFDFTDDERACRRCNFLKVCPKWTAP